MSKEIKLTGGVRYTPSITGLKGIDSGIREVFADAGNDYTTGTQDVDNSETALTKDSAIGTTGYVLIVNTDEETDVVAGFADVSTADDARPITVKAGGGFALFHANGTINVRTTSGTARVEYWIFESA